MDTLINLATVVFVVSSMLAMGLSLTPTAILEPLRSPRFVVVALGVNFVVVPLLAVGIQAMLGLDDPPLTPGFCSSPPPLAPRSFPSLPNSPEPMWPERSASWSCS